MFHSYLHSPIGLIRITAHEKAVTQVHFMADDEAVEAEVHPNEITEQCALQLREYFEGSRKHFDLPLEPEGTTFQQGVWAALNGIPFGKTTNYAGIAHGLNNPKSIRAVGAANGRNPIAIIIPCHRVIGSDGSLTGYAGGLHRKAFLLKHEGVAGFDQASLF